MINVKQLLAKHSDKIKFIIIGGFNTVLDFAILFALSNFLQLDKLISNIISTSIAMVSSYLLNKKYTFENTSKSRTQLIKFLVVTIAGLWGLQTIIIQSFSFLFVNIINNANLTLFIGKIIATGASMVWNFILYKKFVFADQVKTKD